MFKREPKPGTTAIEKPGSKGGTAR
jgi:hypothetical protein